MLVMRILNQMISLQIFVGYLAYLKKDINLYLKRWKNHHKDVSKNIKIIYFF